MRNPSLLCSGPGDFEVVDREIPEPHPGEVLIERVSCGVCGTDIAVLFGKIDVPYPIVAGHELSGIVVAVGEGVGELKPGNRVVVDPLIVCGSCNYCKSGRRNLCKNLVGIGRRPEGGGFTRYCVIPARQVCRLPSDADLVEASLVEPVACCLHGIAQANMKPPGTTLLFGGGAIGLILAQLLRLEGWTEILIIEPNQYRRAVAAQLGFTALSSFEEGIRADLAIDSCGMPQVLTQALSSLKPGGCLLFFGVNPVGSQVAIDPHYVYRNEIRLVGTYSFAGEFERAIQVVLKQDLDLRSLITAQIPLNDLPEFLRSDSLRRNLKVVVVG